MRYIQYGCGPGDCPDGWVNYDSSPTLRLELMPGIGSLLRASKKSIFHVGVKYGDIVKGLPEKEGSAQCIYCSHVLEHIDRESVSVALKNTLSLLVSGGTFRFIVPCIEWRARKMISEIDSGDALAVERFMQSSYLGSSSPNRSFSQRLRRVLGNSAHLWMYDYNLMEKLLQEAGFVDIRRCELGDAEDSMFSSVEEIGRFVDDGHLEVAIEARRPG
jgi:hypothetical protein